MNEFEEKCREHLCTSLIAKGIHTFQVNVGYLCNHSCIHCHHRAGPLRKEVMDRVTMDILIERARAARVPTVDITGGAPEMNPYIKHLLIALRRNGHRVLLRTNITILLEGPYRDLPGFYRENGVELIASLPCYLCEEVDEQRGIGVFEKSIEGLRMLNSLGYGRRPDLPLHLVFNPLGAFLPAPQRELEADYKRELKVNHDIDFTDLYTITNMPMGRFMEDLVRKGLEKDYRELLRDNFNPSTLNDLMCLSQINIGWDGRLYDCDFNQALGFPVMDGFPMTVFDLDAEAIPARTIITGAHCFGCTAGAGSSCTGALVR